MTRRGLDTGVGGGGSTPPLDPFFRSWSPLMVTIGTRIGPADHGRTMTLEELRDAEVEEGYRYELARGVLEVTEVPNDPHGQVVDNLHQAVTTYRHHHPGLIRRVGGAGEFRLWVPGMGSGRNPDLAIVFEGTPKDE